MKIWQNIALVEFGIIIGFVLYLKLKKPDITAETYVDEQNQRIGKIKQKGEGNVQRVKASIKTATHKQFRKAKQKSRKSKRLSRKRKLK